MGQRDGTDWGLQASHETGHDDDGQDLHRPLHANYKKEITQLILAMSGSGRGLGRRHSRQGQVLASRPGVMRPPGVALDTQSRIARSFESVLPPEFSVA